MGVWGLLNPIPMEKPTIFLEFFYNYIHICKLRLVLSYYYANVINSARRQGSW